MAAAQQRLDQIRDLVNQWEQIVGFTVEVPDWMVNEMAESMQYVNGHAVQSLYDVGQYMRQHVGNDGAHTWHEEQFFGMPWAQYGMSHSEYQQRYEASSVAYFKLTGRDLDVGVWDSFMRAAEGQLTGDVMQTMIMKDGFALKNFGWLRFGLDFEQFQQQKQQMMLGIGVTDSSMISDAQALLQIQYTHRNAGGNQEVGVQPTLTQQEKKTANVGVSQSEVR